MGGWIRKNCKDILVLMFIIAIVISLGTINISLPGVYFDSAITDYLASIIVHPEIDNSQTTMSHVGLPLLGSIYHGSASMFLQIIVLLFFEASVITLRVPYLFYYVIAVFLMYKIINKLSSRKSAFVGTIILSCMIYVVTLTRTQYDIMLLGVVFF